MAPRKAVDPLSGYVTCTACQTRVALPLAIWGREDLRKAPTCPTCTFRLPIRLWHPVQVRALTPALPHWLLVMAAVTFLLALYSCTCGLLDP